MNPTILFAAHLTTPPQLRSSLKQAPNVIGRLSITVAQAKLVRNYGLTRMDPYARIRVGHFVYETQTDANGGKTPRWNRVIHSQLPAGVATVSIEIYDECSFKMDELIAWTEVRIPESVLKGQTHEEWFSLSGKQGDHVEGMVDVVMSFVVSGSTILFALFSLECVVITEKQTSANNVQILFISQPAAAMAQYQGYAAAPPVVMVPNVSGRAMPVFVTPQVPVPQQMPQQAAEQPAVQPVTEDDIKQVQEMFPNIDVEVIKSVFEANNGNKSTTINSLLQLTEP